MKKLDSPPYRIYIEQRAMTKDGWRWLSWEDYAIKDDNGNTVEIQAIGRDITDKKYSDKIKTQAIFDAIEKERSRISRDLHDDLGQILTGAKLKLESVNKKYLVSGSDQSGYKEAVEMLSSVGKHLRNIVHDLHPTEIERYGIFLALDSLIFQIQKLSGIKILYDYSGYSGDWNKNNDLTIYRIVQEALNNVVKHSKATKASVIVQGTPDEYKIIVNDNGVGFDVHKISSIKKIKSGFGLVNIQQRVELIGGRIKITSNPNDGTLLQIIFLKEGNIE
jgi:signal transduction histidine kinase